LQSHALLSFGITIANQVEYKRRGNGELHPHGGPVFPSPEDRGRELVRMKRKGRLLLVLGIVFLVLAWGIAWSQVTERVSVDSAGNEGNNASAAPSNSSDGRYVAFESLSTNLVAGDTKSQAPNYK